MTPDRPSTRVGHGIVVCLDQRSGSTVQLGETFHDWFTGLPNRAAFRARLGRVLDTAAEGGPPVSVLVLGLDGLSEVHELHGYAVGARLLAHVARLLQAYIPAPHELASLGGGEFGVLVMDDPGEVAATSMAVRVLRALHAPLRVSGRPVRTRARIGITSTRPDQDVDAVLQHAYAALALTRRS